MSAETLENILTLLVLGPVAFCIGLSFGLIALSLAGFHFGKGDK